MTSSQITGSQRMGAQVAGSQTRTERCVWPRSVLVVALAAMLSKLLLAATTEGTNDVRMYLVFLRAYLGSGAELLYETDVYFNHPPFVLRFLQGVRALAASTGLSWAFCLRLPAILADFGSALLLCRIAADEGLPGKGSARARTTLCLVAAAPASILVSGFHGNTDSVMIFFTLLSLHWLARSDRAWLAGAAMGMSLNVKVVPLVFWPVLLFWIPGWKQRTQFFGAALCVVAASSLPVLLQAPGTVARNVLGYGSMFGIWGLSRLGIALSVPDSILIVFESYGRWILASGIVGLSFWMNRRAQKPSLYRQLGVIAFALLAFSPGFSVQYLIWLVPWLVGMPLLPTIAYLVLSGALLVLVYTFWCQDVSLQAPATHWLSAEFWRRGLPWEYADAFRVGRWPDGFLPLEIACWLCVVVLFALQVRAALRVPPPTNPAPGGNRDVPVRYRSSP